MVCYQDAIRPTCSMLKVLGVLLVTSVVVSSYSRRQLQRFRNATKNTPNSTNERLKSNRCEVIGSAVPSSPRCSISLWKKYTLMCRNLDPQMVSVVVCGKCRRACGKTRPVKNIPIYQKILYKQRGKRPEFFKLPVSCTCVASRQNSRSRCGSHNAIRPSTTAAAQT